MPFVFPPLRHYWQLRIVGVFYYHIPARVNDLAIFELFDMVLSKMLHSREALI
jgi:hypothetical protein